MSRPQSQARQVHVRKGTELEIEFEKLAGIPLGIQVSALNSPRGTRLVVGKINATGSVEEYNRRSRSPFKIQQGDIITRVNNLSEHDVGGMAEALRVAGKLSLTVRRGEALAAINNYTNYEAAREYSSQTVKATARPAASEATSRLTEPEAAGQSSLGYHGNSTYFVCSNGKSTLKFDAVLYNNDGIKFGIEVVPSYDSRGLEVKYICDSGLVPAWNFSMAAPYHVGIGDIIAIPSGRTCRKTIAEWRTASEVKLTVMRPVSDPGAVSAAIQGSAVSAGAKRRPPPPPPLEKQRPASAPRSLSATLQPMEDAPPQQTLERWMTEKGGKYYNGAGKGDKDNKGQHMHQEKGDGMSSSAVERWVPAARDNPDDQILEFQVSMTRPSGTKLGIVVVVRRTGIVGLSVSRVVFDGYIANWNRRSKAPKRVQAGDIITVVNGVSGQDKLEDMCVKLSLENTPLEFTVVRIADLEPGEQHPQQYPKVQPTSKGQALSKGQKPMAEAALSSMSKGSGYQWFDKSSEDHSNKLVAAGFPPQPAHPPTQSRRGAGYGRGGYGYRWQGWHPADSLTYESCSSEDIAAEAMKLCNSEGQGSSDPALMQSIAELPCATAAALLSDALGSRPERVGQGVNEALPMMNNMQHQ